MGAHGEYICVVDRVLAFKKSKPDDTVIELSDVIVSSLRERSGEHWENVRRKMRVFTPDGAGDEQLAGLLASETFPNMVGVLRCVAHMATSAMEAGWKADPLVTEIQTQVVQEVAKYLRHSERFAQIVQAKAEQQEIHVLATFAFAPHRFGSIERP